MYPALQAVAVEAPPKDREDVILPFFSPGLGEIAVEFRAWILGQLLQPWASRPYLAVARYLLAESCLNWLYLLLLWAPSPAPRNRKTLRPAIPESEHLSREGFNPAQAHAVSNPRAL